MLATISTLCKRLPTSVNSVIERSSRSRAVLSARSNSTFMGDNIVNFYAGQPPLNRLSFQRNEAHKINAHLNNPQARFTVYRDGKPLVQSDAPGSTVFLAKSDVGSIVGVDFAAPSSADAEDKDRKRLRESARLPPSAPALVFLGIDDRSGASADAVPAAHDPLDPRGVPYFAVDATNTDWTGETHGVWGDPRASGSAMSGWEAGVFALSRALVDWNWRNKFCAACGSPTYSLWAGWKRSCTSALEPIAGKEPCFSTKGLHNFAYPRTDPVIIMGILDSTGERMLLGRQKSWPEGMYSCLAGFVEPGESFEDAVRREVLEEAGIEVGPVSSSSQPWPYPANLMVGCFGRARDGQTIRLDLDNELEDAQWFSRDAIAKLVAVPGSSNLTRADLDKLDKQSSSEKETAAALAPAEGQAGVQRGGGKGLTRVPPETAIAGMLVRQWARGGLELVSKL